MPYYLLNSFTDLTNRAPTSFASRFIDLQTLRLNLFPGSFSNTAADP